MKITGNLFIVYRYYFYQILNKYIRTLISIQNICSVSLNSYYLDLSFYDSDFFGYSIHSKD